MKHYFFTVCNVKPYCNYSVWSHSLLFFFNTLYCGPHLWHSVKGLDVKMWRERQSQNTFISSCLLNCFGPMPFAVMFIRQLWIYYIAWNSLRLWYGTKTKKGYEFFGNNSGPIKKDVAIYMQIPHKLHLFVGGEIHINFILLSVTQGLNIISLILNQWCRVFCGTFTIVIVNCHSQTKQPLVIMCSVLLISYHVVLFSDSVSGFQLSINTTANITKLRIPYPQTGTWYLSLRSLCATEHGWVD